MGLGNPGREYEGNRHNVGFMCVSHFGRTQGIRFDKKQAEARTGSGTVAGSGVILARPQTYMNRSGYSVARLVKKFNIGLEDILVIHDDLDLPLGRIRLRPGGGSGGHKGVDSIIGELGSRDFPRLRVGIGRPPVEEGSAEASEDDIISYVLRDFSPEEKQIITYVIPRVSRAILCLLTDGLTAAMNSYNRGTAEDPENGEDKSRDD